MPRLPRMLARLGLLLCALVPGGCDVLDTLPRDQQGSLERARGGTQRVGLIHNPPLVSVAGDAPSGHEVALIRGWARTPQATPRRSPDGGEAVLAALSRNELDLVAGGLTRDTPWAGRVTVTRVYGRCRIVRGLAARPPQGAPAAPLPAAPLPAAPLPEAETVALVLAVAPGESALLMALERWLLAHGTCPDLGADPAASPPAASPPAASPPAAVRPTP